MKNKYIDLFNKLSEFLDDLYNRFKIDNFHQYTVSKPKKKLFMKEKEPDFILDTSFINEIDSIKNIIIGKELGCTSDFIFEHIELLIDYFEYLRKYCLYIPKYISTGYKSNDIKYIIFKYSDYFTIKIEIETSKIKKINNNNVALSLISSKEESLIKFYTISVSEMKESYSEVFKFISNESFDLDKREANLLNLIYRKLNFTLVIDFIDSVIFCIKSHINISEDFKWSDVKNGFWIRRN